MECNPNEHCRSTKFTETIFLACYRYTISPGPLLRFELRPCSYEERMLPLHHSGKILKQIGAEPPHSFRCIFPKTSKFVQTILHVIRNHPRLWIDSPIFPRTIIMKFVPIVVTIISSILRLSFLFPRLFPVNGNVIINRRQIPSGSFSANQRIITFLTRSALLSCFRMPVISSKPLH